MLFPQLTSPGTILGILLFSGISIMTSHSINAGDLPNVLWISSEDHGPHMGCYGDEYATTPNVDALAARGLLYTRAWSNAPVCAPARTTIISGLYATSSGGEQMRSQVDLPAGFQMFPQYLREVGYYCTNNSKEDYNLNKPGKVWDESSKSAHWKNRSDDQPFFAVFNSTATHESKLRVRPHEAIHDPAGVRVPAYHPDTPEVRQDWAQYYDTITEADSRAGERLRELEDAGLSEDTIIFYWSDHGSGMPRNKRFAANTVLGRRKSRRSRSWFFEEKSGWPAAAGAGMLAAEARAILGIFVDQRTQVPPAVWDRLISREAMGPR
jgi:arylsulfatase A-like enzyme